MVWTCFFWPSGGCPPFDPWTSQDSSLGRGCAQNSPGRSRSPASGPSRLSKAPTTVDRPGRGVGGLQYPYRPRVARRSDQVGVRHVINGLCLIDTHPADVVLWSFCFIIFYTIVFSIIANLCFSLWYLLSFFPWIIILTIIIIISHFPPSLAMKAMHFYSLSKNHKNRFALANKPNTSTTI